MIASSIARSWHKRSSLPCSGAPARQVPLRRSQVATPLHASPSSHCSSPVQLPVGSVVVLVVGRVVVVGTGPPHATLASSEASGARSEIRRVLPLTPPTCASASSTPSSPPMALSGTPSMTDVAP